MLFVKTMRPFLTYTRLCCLGH